VRPSVTLTAQASGQCDLGIWAPAATVKAAVAWSRVAGSIGHDQKSTHARVRDRTVGVLILM
jgi:hypothetical protein